VPVEGRAQVHATIKYPDATLGTAAMAEVGPGAFEATIRARMPGLYRLTLMASGVTFRGSRKSPADRLA
jgi:hypothetical protein